MMSYTAKPKNRNAQTNEYVNHERFHADARSNRLGRILDLKVARSPFIGGRAVGRLLRAAESNTSTWLRGTVFRNIAHLVRNLVGDLHGKVRIFRRNVDEAETSPSSWFSWRCPSSRAW